MPLSWETGLSTPAHEAMLASFTIRQRARADLADRVCVYDVCEALGVTVRFNDIASLEGMYEAGPRPRIHISALRPLPRRVFNTAHELGHHVFRHGTTLHELTLQRTLGTTNTREELMANVFAGFLLMPALGIWRGLSDRQITFDTASPLDILALACDFGVGYRTLITHARFNLGELRHTRAAELLRHSPKSIRAQLLPEATNEWVVIIDDKSRAPSFDLELGNYLLAPTGSRLLGNGLVFQRTLGELTAYRAMRTGITSLMRQERPACYVRVAKPSFIGLAKYRHLGDAEDDD